MTFEQWARALLDREELEYDCLLEESGLPASASASTHSVNDGAAQVSRFESIAMSC